VSLLRVFHLDHGELFDSTQFNCFTLEYLDLRDDHVSDNLSLLTRVKFDVLALAHDFNLAVVAVEESKADAETDRVFIWIFEVEGLVSPVLNYPHVAIHLLDGCSRSLLCRSCLFSWGSLRRSWSSLNFLFGGSWGLCRSG